MPRCLAIAVLVAASCVAPLVAHFSSQRKLSKKDIADLKRLIQELDDER